MRLRKFGSAMVLIAAIGALAASGESESGGGGNASSEGSGSSNAPENDVSITACQMSSNQFMGPEATVKITNNSSKPSNYLVEVIFETSDGSQQLDTASVIVNNLASGQSAQETASSLKAEAKDAGSLNCKVADVTRYAS